MKLFLIGPFVPAAIIAFFFHVTWIAVGKGRKSGLHVAVIPICILVLSQAHYLYYDWNINSQFKVTSSLDPEQLYQLQEWKIFPAGIMLGIALLDMLFAIVGVCVHKFRSSRSGVSF